MGVMDKFLNYMKLNDDEDDYDYEDDYMDEEPEIPRKSSVSKSTVRDEIPEEQPAPVKRPMAGKVTPIGRAARKGSGGMEVCVIKPSTVEDAREITETLLGNRTVVMNLEGLDVDIAQRILDFTSGSCYAINGNLQKISMYIFIITPASVDISGDFQEILGSFNASSLNSGL